MLTLYYVSATFLQSWRIKSVCQKISEHLAQQASIAFYTLAASSDDGYDVAFATSELCKNRGAAKVSEILWLHGNHRGCCLLPMQTLQTTPWITFPEAPGLHPFAYQQPTEQLLHRLTKQQKQNKEQLLRLLLEIEIVPCCTQGCPEEIVRIENYGKLLAWKVDSHLAVLIETDVEYFTKLLIATFLQNNFLVNDKLTLLRIESIKDEGTPQPYDLLANHLRKSARTDEQLDDPAWSRHLEDLRALSVLANQAAEYEYNKNRTEGKTGVLKPDLIPQEQRAAESTKIGTESPKKPQKHAIHSEVAVAEKKLQSPQDALQNGHKLELTADSKKTTKIEQDDDVMQKSTDRVVLPTSPVTTMSMSPTKSPKKMRATPTKIKSPGFVEGSRFKSRKVSESPTKTEDVMKVEPVCQESRSPESPAKPVAVASVVEKSPQSTSPQHSGATTSATSIPSVNKNNAKRPSLRRYKDSFRESKPLNVLVYSDSGTARENAVTTLKEILAPHTYTIYPITVQQVEQKHWTDSTALLVVCGSVALPIAELFVDFFLHGGKLLSLCSDVLHFILPTYRTAEVREHELVQFSYDKWQKVQMMHHIFCYQPSPVKKNFSTDSEDSFPTSTRKPALVCPRSLKLKDLRGDLHQLDVRVLGTEETWNTPSLLLANNKKTGGAAVFSQVHLEITPNEFEGDEAKFTILKQNERIRHEIFSDLLKTHLGVHTQSSPSSSLQNSKDVFQNAYFLGRHEFKFELIEKLKKDCAGDGAITTSNLTIKFCGRDDVPPTAKPHVLPILTHSCPEDFSTVEYFDTLKTKYIGRLVIYAPILTSSQDLITELELTNGIVVIPRRQTAGVGRNNNQWLSPLGCAMFSTQLHISLNSVLGSHLPLIQHIVGAAMVNTFRRHALYKNLDVGLKWPNDTYANGILKIGGLVVKTTLLGEKALVNIGCGLNLDNSKPTTCINDIIRDYNHANEENLPPLKYEHFFALTFNEIERLVEMVQSKGGLEDFYELYYNLWLHNNQTVIIWDKDGTKKDAQIVGIDEYGYLKVKLSNGSLETVQPDGNSFDMLKGLIIPKFH